MLCHTFFGDSRGIENKGYGEKVICNNCIVEESEQQSPVPYNDDVNDENELQSNVDDKGTSLNGKKRYRSNDAPTKLESIE